MTVTQTPAAGTQISVGTTTVTLHVKDALNNEATCTATLTVNYSFTGFFPPVDNLRCSTGLRRAAHPGQVQSRLQSGVEHYVRWLSGVQHDGL